MSKEIQKVLIYLDSHIRQWRENHTHEDPYLRQRAIDACDALQQLRLQLFGELLPLPNALAFQEVASIASNWGLVGSVSHNQ